MGRADFQVYIENRRVKAGSKLQGAVYLDVNKKISGNSVVVSFVGKETTLVLSEANDMSKRSHVPKKLRPFVKGAQAAAECSLALIGGETASTAAQQATSDGKETKKEASMTIMSVEIPVGTRDMIDGRRIEPGQYKLPFEIDLPPTLPCTFSIDEKEGFCGVSYHLEAQLKGSGFFKDYQDSVTVYVDAKPADDNQIPVPFEGPPKEMAVRLFGRLGQAGGMAYACRASNTVVGCGQDIKVNFACVNNSTMGIQNVVAVLKQRVEWKAKGFSHHYSERIATKSFGTWDKLRPISHKEAKARREGGKLKGNGRQDNEDPTASSQDKDDPTVATERGEQYKLLESLNHENHSLSIEVPTNAIPTYEGKLIRVSHVLKIKVVSQVYFNWMMPVPNIEIPLQILDATDKHLGLPPVVPPDWVEDGALIVAHAVLAGGNQVNYAGEAVEAGGPATGPPSLELLVRQLQQSSNAEALMSQKVQDPAWRSILGNLPPSGCGSVLAAVDLDFRKLVVAVVVAETCGPNYTCAHATESVRVCPAWMRVSMVRQMLPYCTDLAVNSSLILAELSDWEKTVTEYDFEQAMLSVVDV